MDRFLVRALVSVSVPLLLCTAARAEEARMLRFPHLQGDKLVFVYGGDLWTCSSQGGVARRLTSYDEGVELSPRISPDGESVAFSGEYGGSRQIYLVPFAGGSPRQLTWYPDVGPLPPRGGYDNLVMDWTPDGSKILVRSHRTPYGDRNGKYFLVDPDADGGLETPLQIPEGGPATFSPDASKLAYNIISREWRTWKRYKAGRAQDVFVYDLAADTVERITDFEGTDNHPMWIGDRIYFTSDRTRTLNLFAYDVPTGETRQITRFEDYDVLFPARGQGGIAFEAGGWLWVMDEETEEVRRLEIELADDRPWLRPKWIAGKGNARSFDVSPAAKRLAVEVRGDVFSVPKEKGEARNLTRTPERRERDVRWSPDGKSLSYLAEVGDDYELFVRELDGKDPGTERQLTSGTGAWILEVDWSPDSTRLFVTDKKNRLRAFDAATGAATEVDSASEDTIRSVAWSGDSRWLTYVKRAPNGFDTVWIAAADGSGAHRVTTDRFDHGFPAFDPEGRYVYFVSARDFDYGSLDFNGRLYALLLRDDVESPMAPQSDDEESPAEEDEKEGKDEKEEEEEEEEEEEAEPAEASEESAEADAEEKDEKKDDDKKDEAPAPVEIDFDGIEARLVALPGPPGGYFNLEGVKGGFLFVHGGDLKRYDLEKRESETIVPGATGYMVTPDFTQLAYRHGPDLCIAKVEKGQEAGKGAVPLDRVSLRIEPRVEWRQIYGDCWRIMRDWFYDPAMHRVDWTRMRERYAPLVEHVAHRDDLDFVMGELIGELNCGHTYVFRGESPRVDRVQAGALGCELVADGDRYRISRIFQGRAWEAGAQSPLLAAGVDAKEGDWLLAIDGEDVTTADNPYRFLENKQDRDVTLTLNESPDADGAREVVVRPVGSEQRLFYLDWVAHNARLVDELSGGRIGYVHVPDTAQGGHEAFFEGFRALARVKDAMLVDDRYNGGGHIPDRMIAALDSPVMSWWARRDAEMSPTPDYGFDGPMAMLINGYSSSGGDAFPFYFRKRGLGPLIGSKTWGGLVGYSGTPDMVDGGGLAVPSFAFVNTDGEWDVEYVGVAPDIEVFDDPTRIQRGEDPTIEVAVQYLMKELEQNPTPRRPPVPEGPDRSQ